jgi:hypothetical protein
LSGHFVRHLVSVIRSPEHRTPVVHLYIMKGMNYMPHAEIAQIRQPSARTLLYRRLTVGRPWTPDNLCPPIHYEGMSRHFQSRGGGAPKMDTANFAPDGPYIIGTSDVLSAAPGLSAGGNRKPKMTANFEPDVPYIIETHVVLSVGSPGQNLMVPRLAAPGSTCARGRRIRVRQSKSD